MQHFWSLIKLKEAITIYSRLLISRCQREIKINIDLSIHPLIHHPPKEEKKQGDNHVGQLHNDGRKNRQRQVIISL